MLPIGIRGRFGNYSHHELFLARQKQDFGAILTQIRAASPDEASSRLLSADQSQDRGGASQTAMELRRISTPLSRIDSSGSLSRQDASSSADLSGIDKIRELARLILDTDDVKRNLVASEFLALTEAEFQGILDEAAAILRRKEASYDRTHYDCPAAALVAFGVMGLIAMLGIFRSVYYAISMQHGNTEEAIIGDEKGNSNWMTILYCLALAFTSINTIQTRGCIHAYNSLVSRSKKIRELRNQFQEFCASIRGFRLRRGCRADTPCSISKESITRFFACAGLAGAAVGFAATAPYLDAWNTADAATRFNLGNMSLADSDEQMHGMVWFFNFSVSYVCGLTVPLVFMANVFSGLKRDVVELFGGARYRNERVQDTVHNLRALFARLLQDNNFERFAEDLIHQKYIGSPECMLMDYVSKIELDANALEVGGVTQDILEQHGLERTCLAVFCSEAKQIMDALPDREIDPAEALEVINDLRFDVSFRNKVLSELKFEDARYNDGWVRFTGGARTLARLGLGWLAMNTFFGTFSSSMIVRHYRHEAGIAENVALSCELFANKTITPFNSVRFHMGIASSAAQGIALGNAAMNTLDAGWIMFMMGYSSITTGTRMLPGLSATTAGGKIRGFLGKSCRLLPVLVPGAIGTALYVHAISLSCQNSNDVVTLMECPHLLDMPDSPIIRRYRGSCYTHMAYMASVLPMPLINDWDYILIRASSSLFRTATNKNANSNTEREIQSRQESVELQREAAPLTVATTDQEAAPLTVVTTDQQAGSSADRT